MNTAGVSGDKDNDSIRGAGGGLKSPETFTGDVCFCVWRDFCVGEKKKEKIRVEANRNWKMWFFWRAASKSSCILSSRQGKVSSEDPIPSRRYNVHCFIKTNIIEGFGIFLGISGVPDWWTESNGNMCFHCVSVLL